MYHKIIIIGGGASGLLASITAKDMGQDIAILEGSDRIGKKILSTGNGRCNISNTDVNNNRYHSKDPSFMKNVLELFSVKKQRNFSIRLDFQLLRFQKEKYFHFLFKLLLF